MGAANEGESTACALQGSVRRRGAMPALPFSPLKFSGEIERVTALERKEMSPRPMGNLLNGGSVVTGLSILFDEL